jgi:hypothetical protein
MDREVLLLRQLQTGLSGWTDFIRRATGAREVELRIDGDGGFTVIGVWYVGTAVERREDAVTFHPIDLFGYTLGLPAAGRQLLKRPCDCAREFVRKILERRGVLS